MGSPAPESRGPKKMLQEDVKGTGDEDPFAPFTAPVPLRRFMELMKNDSAKEFVRKMNKFLLKFEQSRRNPQDDSAAIQGFLEKLEGEFRKHKVWKNTPGHELAMMMEGVEKYLTLKLYNFIFGRYVEDRERDQMLAVRMAALQFVQPCHLDIPKDLITETSLILAVKELQKMNGTKCPRDKLVCILNCCRNIIQLLKEAGRAGDGADIFVPVLNYVVIRCQPEKLISNIEFIKRFRMSSRLTSLAEYYFMQLSVSALFIETAHAKSFTGGQQQFLKSFHQQGLISQQQYQEAMEASNGRYSIDNVVDADVVTHQKHLVHDFSKPPIPPGSRTEESTRLDYTDNGSIVSSEPSNYRSPRDQMEVNWDRISSFEELPTEGATLLAQHVAEGSFARKYPLMSASISSLSLGQMEALAAKYRCMVLSYEMLKEASLHKDSTTIVRLLQESSEGRYGSSIWPSDGVLLCRYPFMCAQVPNLTLGEASQLLTEYKEIILKYEILELALKRRVRKVHWSADDSCVLPELDPELVNNVEAAEMDKHSDHARDMLQQTDNADRKNTEDIQRSRSGEIPGSTSVEANQTSPVANEPSEVKIALVENGVSSPATLTAADRLATGGDTLSDIVPERKSTDFSFSKVGGDLDPGNLIDMGTELNNLPQETETQDSSTHRSQEGSLEATPLDS